MMVKICSNQSINQLNTQMLILPTINFIFNQLRTLAASAINTEPKINIITSASSISKHLQNIVLTEYSLTWKFKSSLTQTAHLLMSLYLSFLIKKLRMKIRVILLTLYLKPALRNKARSTLLTPVISSETWKAGSSINMMVLTQLLLVTRM